MPGYQVLFWRLGLQGKNKLDDRWEEEAFVITSQPNTSIPVFTIRQIDGNSHCQTVHCNLSLPVRYVLLQSINPHQWSLIHPWWWGHVPDSELLVPTTLVLLKLWHKGRQIMTTHGATTSTMVPQHSTSLLACKADSSLDLDEDEASVLLEESLIMSDNDDTRDGLLDEEGHEADLSDLEVDPGHESTDQEQQSSVQSSLSGVRDGPSGSEVVRQRRIFGVNRSLLGWGLECGILVNRTLFYVG